MTNPRHSFERPVKIGGLATRMAKKAVPPRTNTNTGLLQGALALPDRRLLTELVGAIRANTNALLALQKSLAPASREDAAVESKEPHVDE